VVVIGMPGVDGSKNVWNREQRSAVAANRSRSNREVNTVTTIRAPS
jgi:hypothetical protein